MIIKNFFFQVSSGLFSGNFHLYYQSTFIIDLSDEIDHFNRI